MKIIEIHENSHKKLIKDAKKAELLICDLIETLTDLYETSKLDKREDYEYSEDDFEDDDDDMDMKHIYMRNMRRGGRRSMRRGRYAY